MPTVSQNADLDMLSTSKILNLPDPTSAQDAATKAYVDAHGIGTFTASRALVTNSSGAVAVSTTTSAQIAALATLTNGRVPFSSGGALTDSANATLDASGNLTLAGTAQAAYFAVKGLFNTTRQDMTAWVDVAGTYRWASGLDASNNLYFNDQVNNKDVLTLLVGATYTTARLPAAGTLSFNGGVTTIGLSSQATLSNTLEVNRGKILANSGSLGNVLAFSYYVTGNVAATNYSRITGTFTGTRTATLPDADITVAGSASTLTSGRVPYVTTGGLLIDSAGYLFDGTSIITLGVAGTSVGGLKLNNATSGSITLQPVTGALGTVTASFPAASIVVAGSASALTSGRVPFATTGGLLTDSGTTWDSANSRFTVGTSTGSWQFNVLKAGPTDMALMDTTDSINTVLTVNSVGAQLKTNGAVIDLGVGASYTLSTRLTTAAFSPYSASGITLGTSSLPWSTLYLTPSSSSTIGQIIKLAASQSADALMVQDSTSAVLSSITKDGYGGFGTAAVSTASLKVGRAGEGLLTLYNSSASSNNYATIGIGSGSQHADGYFFFDAASSPTVANQMFIFAYGATSSTFYVGKAGDSGGVTFGPYGAATLTINDNIGTATASTGIQLGAVNAGSAANASGVRINVNMPATFAPTSGTGTFRGLNISNVINQTGGANGITRSLYINPTLTSAADFRHIEIAATTATAGTNQAGVVIGALSGATNNTHLLLGTTTIPSGNYAIYQTGSSYQNYFQGHVGITTLPQTTVALSINKSFTDMSTSQYGIQEYLSVGAGGGSDQYGSYLTAYFNSTTSAGTGAVAGTRYSVIHNGTVTLASALGVQSFVQNWNSGNTTTGYAFFAGSPVLSSTGVIVTNYGHYVANQGATGITSAAAIAVAAQSGATNNTHLLLGTTTIPSGTYGAYIVSSAATAIPLYIKGAASQSGNYLNITSSSGSAGDIVALTSAGLWTMTGLDAVTNAITATQTLQHNSTGTPANSFGQRILFNLHSSTTTNQNAGSVDVYWTDATHATRTSVVALCAVNSAGALAEVFKVKGDGTITPLDGSTIVCGTTTGLKIGSSTSNKLAFFNSTPIVQFATTGETAGFTANASTAARVDSTFTGNVGSTAYTISDIVKALKNFGLMAA